MFSHQEAVSNITLVALREQPNTGVYVQVGLAYDHQLKQWIEVTEKETTALQSFPAAGYLAIRPASNLSHKIGLATCPGCDVHKSSWRPDTVTACLCHFCTVARCAELNRSPEYEF